MTKNKLEVYEEKCSRCNGTGRPINRKHLMYGGIFSKCKSCSFSGKIDWIDKIKGLRDCNGCGGYGFITSNSGTYKCFDCEGTGKVGYEKET